MEKMDYYLQEVIGKRCRHNIYSKDGELLVPISTVITYDHVIFLEEKGITLSKGDVQDVGEDFQLQSEVINETVEKVRTVFMEIRETKEVPITALRKEVIPLIHEVGEKTPVLHLFKALQAKDDYTYRHNIAVGAISNLIGKWMGLKQEELFELTTAGLLHDVGKMLIPESILNKPGRLSDEEFALMKEHAVYGYQILKEAEGVTHRQALVALQHHERLDGSGYPLGIKGGKIDLFSRTVSIADVFHAMSSNRVYQDPFPFYRVLSEMSKDMFNGLDPEITMLFIAKTMESLIGSPVRLTDGRVGKIIMVPVHNPIRPLIRVGDDFIDLAKDSSLQIEQLI